MPFSSQSLRRRAKKFLLRNELDLFIPVLPSLEHVAADELRKIGSDTHVVRGGVELRGDLSTIYEANLQVRTGNYVFLRLGHFLSQSYPMLYDHARHVDWAAVLGNCQEISIHVSSRTSKLSHKNNARKVIYDAICARLAEQEQRPNLVKNGVLAVHARIHEDRCTLSLNTSGAHLHRRGYRRHVLPAPIRETTAAGLLQLAESKNYDVLIDPFCGTGTFPIEAEQIARNCPPGLRRVFAIESSPLHAPGTLRHAKRLAVDACLSHSTQTIMGSDVSSAAIEAGRHNAEQAAARDLQLRVADALTLDFGELASPHSKRLIVSNLPYGKRLGTPTSAESLIKSFCEHIAESARGWAFALVTPRNMPIRHPGLLIDKELAFVNGGVPVIFTLGHVPS